MQSSVEFLPTINRELSRISGVNKPVNCLHLLYTILYAVHLHIINHLPLIVNCKPKKQNSLLIRAREGDVLLDS